MTWILFSAVIPAPLLLVAAPEEAGVSFWRTIEPYLTFLFSLSVFLIACVIVLENRNPSRTVAWLIVLNFLPVVGFIFYILLGRNVRKRKLFRNKFISNAEVLKKLETVPAGMLDENDFWDYPHLASKRRLLNLMMNVAESPFTLNNRSKILTNGDETFRQMIQDMSEAKDHIHFQFYIIRHDTTGQQFKQVLIDKAREGVKVRVIYDGVGSVHLDKKYIAELREAGVEVVTFFPVILPFLSNKLNYRNHRKIIVIDGKIGFVGGLNIGDEYLGKDTRFGFWRDSHVRLEGESVYLLQNIFLKDWFFVTNENINDDRYFPPLTESPGEELIQIAASGPDSDWESIWQMYFSIIATAQEKIYITSPYFIPDDSISMALKTAALSGLDVRILLPSRPDHHTVFWASRSYFQELLEAGVRFYLYQPGFVHAKILLVDGVVASIGTANMDIRSFQHNFEVNAIIYNSNSVYKLEEDFLRDLVDSKELTLAEYNQRPWHHRVLESVARLLSPLL
ncbi:MULTISPECIES: cardiolipin synthase [Aneurinibacillus]|uniref:Cardiolipin synthase n=1 Tax=Aneurinibacillus thermoaerophilus TaxID=143495 RepID=A0A1G8CLV9_ANETH|nr:MULTISPECIES: cardiolipin synthase [Aneurinibacillus]MED0680310.1 cardiolipin synthase [Aneurinibacillus thermoaerophilus]MED0737063.1 cardiolipin synthase [Aneurinibacillus thermoaerophilus]MED0757367.1 cardiolipin synthase [Aneurinibacillus thermoaerophilus]MED0762096.1 cardiolipin synthase [Aneurinibacillus thermoaerophilus]MED0765851.1 cardiolipin synthase [Aneurinibacillus thermoaerophilus]